MKVYSNDPKLRGRRNKKLWNYVARDIQEGNLQLKICELDSLFLSSSTKVLTSEEKGSASSSIILFGVLKLNLKSKSEVVAKIFFTSRDPKNDNSLAVEANVYKRIVSELLKTHVTPHLITYIGYAKCDLLKYSGNLMKEIMQEAHKSISPTRYNFNEMNVLLTEKAKGRTLHDHIKSGKLQWKNWQAILFQLVYTIQCFIEIGFMHNDLHSGNIFVDEIPETTFIYFVKIENKVKCFHVTTKYILRIYDFDFATYLPKSPYNGKKRIPTRNTKVRPNSRMCTELGICRDVNWYTDLFRVFSGISRATGPRPLVSWLSGYMNRNLTKDESLAKRGVLCRKTPSSHCTKFTPSIDQLSTPSHILDTGFKNFEVASGITHKFIQYYQPNVYATPGSRNSYPPKSKKNYEISLNMLKKF